MLCEGKILKLRQLYMKMGLASMFSPHLPPQPKSTSLMLKILLCFFRWH